MTAPDGQSIAYTYDELGRVSSVTGGTNYDMFASVIYDKVGRVKEVTRGFSTDATKTVYVYDEAGRTTQIRHETIVGPSTLHQTTYTWNLNNTLASRVETDNFGLTVATVAFTYDNRDRLIREEREQAYNGGSAATAYDYRYGYDQLGNRKWRIDAATSERPAYYYTYLYDTDVDPETLDWPTRNNRLLKYEIRKDSTSGDLLRTVSYTYYKTGHASNITVKDWYVDSSTTPGSAADYDWYHDLALYYFTNGSLRLAISDKWKLDGEGAPTNYTSLTAREFRYDGIGIARYLAVDYNTNNEPTDPGEWTLVGSPMLTDYIGGGAGILPATDSSITYSSSYSATAQTRYFAGDGRQSLGAGGSVADLRYFHGDLLDSRVMATDDSAAAVATTAYTAFGEAVPPLGSPSRPANPSALDTRYQYAGSFEYEAGMLSVGGPNTNLPALKLSHVGARWYTENVGRFIQRAPAGHGGGGSNYVEARPLCRVGPLVPLSFEDVTAEEAKEAVKEILWVYIDKGIKKIEKDVIGYSRAGCRLVYQFCIVWSYVQGQNRKMFRPSLGKWGANSCRLCAQMGVANEPCHGHMFGLP
ncbi:MAG: hypothetical protein IT450_22360 [Phycisphaerales bacterium]|nr:hypothetical protein [Phycisphaerales bacterium]